MRLPSTAALLLLTSFALSSCSGTRVTVCVNNCTGNATVSLVLTATPPPPSSRLSLQAFTATIAGIALTPSSGGNDVAVNLNSTTYIAEFTRVTSDSTLLAAQVSIPAQTYSKVKVTFTAPRVTFCTQATPGLPGCAAGSLAAVTGTAGTATISTTLTFTANQHTGLALNVNLGTALTQNGQAITGVNLGAANAFSVATLPPVSTATDLGSGQLSHINDVVGLVTSVTSSSITIRTSTRGSITATSNSSTQFSSTCSVQSLSCVKVNDDAVIDAILNADGTLTLTFLQPISSGSSDIVEGIVTSAQNSSQLTLVATDSIFTPSSSVLNGQLNLGDQVVVTLSGTVQPFVIVDKGLGPTLPANSFAGATSLSAIQPGMTVAFRVTAFTAQFGTTPGSASTSTFALRFSRVTTSMAAASLPDFSANGSDFPPFFGIATNQQFRTTSGRLSVDGASSLTSIPVGNTISASALFLGTPASPLFAAQTVRAH